MARNYQYEERLAEMVNRTTEMVRRSKELLNRTVALIRNSYELPPGPKTYPSEDFRDLEQPEP
jgi:hypothetical protein